MQTLLPLMETDSAEFLSQSDQCWQANMDWMLAQGLISQEVPLDLLRVSWD